jgi:erythromycin esterase-like protein
MLLLASRVAHLAAIAAFSQHAAVARVVHDVCGERVVLLGEPPSHGAGEAMAFKGEVIRRLVDECHFTAVLFESGSYDFLNIRRRLAAGDTVSQAMIGAAIGGLWANRDVAPLIPFLAERSRHGSLVLGGLDDQLGRGTYAQTQMPAELVQYLGGDDRARCLGALQKHMLWQYTSDAPYGAKDQAAILGCLDAISAKLTAKTLAGAPGYHRAMVENLKRTILRDYDPDAPTTAERDVQVFNGRDRSMYENFGWWRSRLAPGAKIIVWTANNHAAKDLSSVPGQDGRVSLGSYLHRELGADAFALGSSAFGGTYARVGQPVRQLDPAPDSSLEARAFARGDTSTAYLDAARIRAFGRVVARPLGTAFSAADWSGVFDGVVVFRDERPPARP